MQIFVSLTVTGELKHSTALKFRGRISLRRSSRANSSRCEHRNPIHLLFKPSVWEHQPIRKKLQPCSKIQYKYSSPKPLISWLAVLANAIELEYWFEYMLGSFVLVCFVVRQWRDDRKAERKTNIGHGLCNSLTA